ncbi:hypothetical protein [Neisseria bergeri]|uniref:hypothetical protein n=1 Tax=Neisseria bergeri TaxID=1906581 RepID=UPI0027E0F16C|nr:hypothetical protein [Neisseria bergeri]
MKFELETLLEWWADWSAKREDNGLGFGCSRFNRLISAGELPPRDDFRVLLPYGVDGDGIGSLVDQAICRLNPNRRQVIMVEYRRIGTQEEKAKALGITRKAYERRLSNARLNLVADLSVKKLLKVY